jgi:hypothetical protein
MLNVVKHLDATHYSSPLSSTSSLRAAIWAHYERLCIVMLNSCPSTSSGCAELIKSRFIAISFRLV